VYRVTANGVDAVLRVQTSDRLSISARKREFEITRLASNHSVAPKLLAHDVELAYLLSEYVEQYRAAGNNDHEISCLLRLHSICEYPSGPSIRDMLKGYLMSCPEIITTLLKEYDECYKVLDGLPRSVCHLDPLRSNIVGKGDSTRLIDFEYSAVEYSLIDIAMYASQFDCPNDVLQRFVELGTDAPKGRQWQSALLISALVEYAWYESAQHQLNDPAPLRAAKARYLKAKQALGDELS